MEFKNNSTRGKGTMFSFRCPNWLFELIEKQVALTGQTKTDVVVGALCALLASDDEDNSEWTQKKIDNFVAISDWDDQQDQKRQQAENKANDVVVIAADDIKTWERQFKQRWFDG